MAVSLLNLENGNLGLDNLSESITCCLQVLKEASRLYTASWVRDIGPELRPNDYKKDEDSQDSEDKPNGAKKVAKEKEPSTLEDLGKCLLSEFNSRGLNTVL